VFLIFILPTSIWPRIPFNKLKTSLIAFTAHTGFNAILVAGKGVWDAKPRGGLNSANPAWRNNTIVHLGKLLRCTHQALNTVLCDSYDRPLAAAQQYRENGGPGISRAAGRRDSQIGALLRGLYQRGRRRQTQLPADVLGLQLSAAAEHQEAA
jgi:hypothetical protein